ncbi:MAG: 50S ribosomal protein L13 [Bacteroidia bacterium]|nr:50S ribosomal protein L13 [Bacteroidota bacterium]MCZ2130335.1 50S ribosomal protein L13 [Bacteroidia bacterium]
MNTLSYKTISANSATVNKRWFIVDAEGQNLGRLSSQIASVLRGKNKPDFTPHVDCGDYVIVVNAEKVHIPDGRMTQKEYISHSGYPGGQRRITPQELLNKKPFALVEEAVRGMLPKNRLGRKIFHNMFVYVGSEHPHQAQKPQELKFDI